MFGITRVGGKRGRSPTEQTTLPFREKSILPHDMVIFMNLGFGIWENEHDLKPLQIEALSKAIPQKPKPQFPKIELTSFLGIAFGELAGCSHRGGLQE